MMRRRWGRVIAISSVVGFTGTGTGKLHGLKGRHGRHDKVRCRQYAKRNITANCIAPGLIASAMTEKLNEKQRETILRAFPRAKLRNPEDVAAAAVFLASNEAAYVNGQTIHVNGGMAMV